MIKKESCSPSKDNGYTCYSGKSLEILKEHWNARHPDSLIESDTSKDIWNDIRNKLQQVCDKESCWLRQKFMQYNLTDELNYYTFAPEAPKAWRKNINTWLNSLDINNVMKQYEETHSDFTFIGPAPIDFDSHKINGDCVWDELCNFNLVDMLKRNKKKIGLIFNLDKHWEPGSHWVSLFINISTLNICYFDSTGDDIPKEIIALITRIQDQGRVIDVELEFDKNHPFSHQRGNTECGIYSIYYIINMIDDPNFSRFKNKRITDKEMEKHRHIYFRV